VAIAVVVGKFPTNPLRIRLAGANKPTEGPRSSPRQTHG
jgi:hypothetical protein